MVHAWKNLLLCKWGGLFNYSTAVWNLLPVEVFKKNGGYLFILNLPLSNHTAECIATILFKNTMNWENCSFFLCSLFSLHPCSSHDLHLLARVAPLQRSHQHLVPWLLQLEATGKTRMPSPLISKKGVDLKYIDNALEIRNREMQSRTRFMGKNYEMRKSNSLALT